MIDEQAILNLRYQTALTEQLTADENLATAKLNGVAVRTALKDARHALVLTHGMIATDVPGTVADPDSNKNTCFIIDHENEIKAIDAAVAAL